MSWWSAAVLLKAKNLESVHRRIWSPNCWTLCCEMAIYSVNSSSVNSPRISDSWWSRVGCNGSWALAFQQLICSGQDCIKLVLSILVLLSAQVLFFLTDNLKFLVVFVQCLFLACFYQREALSNQVLHSLLFCMCCLCQPTKAFFSCFILSSLLLNFCSHGVFNLTSSLSILK